MTASMFLAFACAIAGGVSALVPGRVPVMRPVSVHARAANLLVLVATTKEERALRISQHGAVSRRAALLGAGALAFSQHNAAWAAGAPPKKSGADPETFGTSSKLLKLTFETQEKLAFSDLGWGDAEAKLLSKKLTRSSGVKKLLLNGNNIQGAGVAALAESLRAGAAPKLNSINLAGNSGVSEEAARALTEAREGLIVSFEQPGAKKTVSELPPTAKREALRVSGQGLDETTLYKLTFEQAETLFFSELGWGDAEAEALSKELYGAPALKKLFLNGNAIQCAGATAIAQSLREGAAPKLKIINLAGNRGITEADKRAYGDLARTDARKGLSVNFVKYKKASDADVYIRADQGKLTIKGALNRASTGELVDGSSATCAEVSSVLDIDRATIKIEEKLLKGMKDPEQIKKVEDIKQALENQVERLEKQLVAKGTKGCNDDKAKLARSTGFPVPFKGYADASGKVAK